MAFRSVLFAVAFGIASAGAANAQSALKIIEGDGDISLLLTDVVLPGGMNGRQLADAAHNVQRTRIPEAARIV